MNKPKAYIAPDILLRILINKHDAKKSLKILESDKCEILSSMFGMYEALACVESSKELYLSGLLFILENCSFVSDDGIDKSLYKVSERRKNHLRKIALSPEENI